MEISLDFLKIIFTLLPGFISAEIIFLLTSYVKPPPFERIIQALIMTALVKGGVVLTDFILVKIGSVMPIDADYILSIIFALLLGLCFSWCANNDFPNRFLRPVEYKSRWSRYTLGLISKLNLTNSGLHPNEWFSFFREADGFAIFHLSGDRRLIGIIEQFPDEPNKGHFIVVNAGWIDDQDNIIPLNNVKKILLSAGDVLWVELIKGEK